MEHPVAINRDYKFIIFALIGEYQEFDISVNEKQRVFKGILTNFYWAIFF